MKLVEYCVLAVLFIQYIQCISLFKRDVTDPDWIQALKLIQKAYSNVEGWLDEDLPLAAKVEVFNETSDVYLDATFHAKLSKSANCRGSYDKWDCFDCTIFLPDGVVIRGFTTHPLNVAGTIVKSEKKKTIYVIMKSDYNFRGKILNSATKLVNHPTIPNAKVQQGLLQSMADVRDMVYRAVRDQLLLHPDYNVHVVGHSYGAGVGSLLVADLHQRLPSRNETNLVGYLLGKPRVGDKVYVKYIADNKISIKRFVQKADSVVHQPPLKEGYMHEGSEYWVNEANKLVYCPGPYETRNCSSSLLFTQHTDHSTYFDVPQACAINFFNFY